MTALTLITLKSKKIEVKLKNYATQAVSIKVEALS